ncbi:MAG: hypothetical protein IJU82_07380, partial [Ruminiclostridium sp.]|nr:hypothetical protein [Ruminiclostridium sp.]
MKTRTKLISVAVAAALLLSGCNVDAPAPAVSESETATSATETTTAEVTTNSAATTTAVTTTAEPEPAKVPASIRSMVTPKGEFETVLRASYSADYEYKDGHETETITEQFLERRLQGYSDEEADKNVFFHYDLDDNTSRVTDSTDTQETLVMEADAAEILVRASTYSFSESEDSDIENRVKRESIVSAGKFPSAYNIVFNDP